MKAISEFVIILLFMIIVLSSISVLWFFYYGYFKFITFSEESSNLGEALSSCMKIDSASSNKIYLKNCGSGLVKSNKINIFMDEEPLEFTMSPDSINKDEIAEITLKELWGLSIESHKIKITSPVGDTERYVKVELPDSTILSLDFDEGEGIITYDKSGYENHGTLENVTGSCGGTACPSWVEGKYGYALDFDGIGDHVDCGNNTSLRPYDSFTIEVWLKSNSAIGGYLVGKYWEYFLLKASDGFSTYFFDSPPEPNCTLTTGGNHICDLGVEYTLSTNRWYHVSGVWDGQIIYIYVNGNLIGSSGESGDNVNQGAGRLYIGGRGDEVSPVNATIDSVRIYNESLKPNETILLTLGELA